MLLPLLGYFFCMIAVLIATVFATISFFSTSTSERVHHYPRPVVERNVTATNEKPRLFMVVPDTKDIPPTEAKPASIPTASPNASIPTEKVEIKKSKPHKPKAFARLRNNYERPGYYGNTPGYAQETQYGLQRPFSNW